MNKPLIIATTMLVACFLTGCAKKIDGQKAYQVNISSNTKQVTGKRSELLKIHGTTSAPDGYEIIAVNMKNKDIPICRNKSMKKYTQVKDGKFTGYIDPLQDGSNVKKGTNLKYHMAAVKNVKKINKQNKQSIKKQFDSTNIKLHFDPITEFVQANVQKALGNGAILSKKSKTVYAITPKKDSNFENEVSKAMYGDKSEWSTVKNKINKLSKQLKTPNGKIALVLINPQNHKKFLLVSINGQSKVDSISSGTTNSNASNVSSTNSDGNDDGDDFDLGLILVYLLGSSDDYDDSDDDSSYDNNDSNYDYDYDDSYDDYNSSQNQGENQSSDSSEQQSTTPSQPNSFAQ